MEKIYITAHAGCEGTALDSIAAVEAGIEAGADIIEVDLNIDEKKRLILCHDQPQVGKNYPEFAKVIALVKDTEVSLNVDIKDSWLIATLNEFITDSELEKRVFYTGLDYQSLRENSDKLAGKNYFLNFQLAQFNPAKFVNLSSERFWEEIFADRLLTNILGINLYYKFVTKELLKVCREKGLLCSVWTVDSLKDMKEMLELGITYITTRQVRTLKQLILKCAFEKY